MSSEWVQPCNQGQGHDTVQGEAEEKEEVKVPVKQEESGGEQPLLPDRSDIKQDMTSEGGPEQIQTQEMQAGEKRERLPHVTAIQDRRDKGSGSIPMERPHRRSFPRSSPTCFCPDSDREPRCTGPFYFVGGANGAEIVSSYCERRGWKRINDKHREDFKLKWCETKSSATYSHFREGEQLVYQIPSNKVLTTKIGLLCSLREYERVSSKVNHGRGLRNPPGCVVLHRRLKMEEFIPTTFRMDVREEREAFFAQQEGVSNKERPMWICKPTGMNQGRGIFLLKGQEEVAAFRLKLQRMEDRQANSMIHHHRQPQARIVQHYIQRPLLLRGKKFDVRSYLLIASTAPFMVFFRHGYVRLTCDLYDPSSSNLSAHLTNQYMQKKSPLYSQQKEDTVWSMERFNTYVNDRFQVAKGLPRDWVLGAFAKRIKQIMTQCFFAVKSKLDCRLGYFDLIGCDFMVDEDFKVWLLEMNCNPALHTNCDVLKEVIPSTVVETLDLALELFNKCRVGRSSLPLANQRDFELLYNGDLQPDTVLASSKVNSNSEFNQKSSKKTQRPEPRRCISASGGLTVPLASPDNASVSGERRASSRSGKRPTSSNGASSPSVQGPSQNSSSVQAMRSKTPGPRLVELKPSPFTLHCRRLKAAVDAKHSKTQRKTKMVASLSSPALSEGTPEACGPLETLGPATPHGPPVCGNKGEGGEHTKG